MKNLTIKNLSALLFLGLTNTMLFAQDSANVTTKSSNTTVTTEQTFMEPWVWVVGAAVIIIIIIALTRGSSNSSASTGTKDEVTYTKKVTRDDNV